jgi:transcription elongation factor Elf1
VRKTKIGYLTCRICTVTHQSRTGDLSRPVDVFCEWVDECQKINDDANKLVLEEEEEEGMERATQEVE